MDRPRWSKCSMYSIGNEMYLVPRTPGVDVAFDLLDQIDSRRENDKKYVFDRSANMKKLKAHFQL